MAQKTSIPKGTRDFGPIEMNRRNYIFDTIRQVFTLFGFQQIETPSMENLSTLMGKYGEEGDKLLFKILNSGDYLRGVSSELLQSPASAKLTSSIAEKGLRYDLTVPFARFVVQHRGELQMPFKRFQIQPVWRADRPQKGRYREFYQCDADVIGSDSLINEVELIQLIDEVFRRFGIRIAIKVNNRKVLAGIAQLIGAPKALIDITVAIDKIDKIGLDNVCEELAQRGLTSPQIDRLKPFLTLSGTNAEKLSLLHDMLIDIPEGLKGVNELQQIFTATEVLGLAAKLELDTSLARGLNYYTGAIFEVKALDVEIGSISGGGRYDNLTGVFGMPGISGVGISFGADRIYDVLNTLNLYPVTTVSPTRVMFVNFGSKEAEYSMQILKQMREHGISGEIFPESVKMKKQMGRADTLGIPFVAIAGENEINAGTITIKNMSTGEQSTLSPQKAIDIIRG